MNCMRTAPPTVLLDLDAVRVVLLVLIGVIVATLALLASESNELTHGSPFRRKHVRIPSNAEGVNASCINPRRPAHRPALGTAVYQTLPSGGKADPDMGETTIETSPAVSGCVLCVMPTAQLSQVHAGEPPHSSSIAPRRRQKRFKRVTTAARLNKSPGAVLAHRTAPPEELLMVWTAAKNLIHRQQTLVRCVRHLDKIAHVVTPCVLVPKRHRLSSQQLGVFPSECQPNTMGRSSLPRRSRKRRLRLRPHRPQWRP